MIGRNCTWRDPRILGVLLVVFLAGAAVGAVSIRIAAQSFGAQARFQRAAAVWKEGGKEISVEKFRKELDLTPEQAQQVEAILDDFVMYYQTLQAQMDDVRANGRTRILLILNPEQKQKFEKMLAQMTPPRIR